MESSLTCVSPVLSARRARAPELPAVSSVWRRGDTPPPPPVDTSSAGNASQSGATPRSGSCHHHHIMSWLDYTRIFSINCNTQLLQMVYAPFTLKCDIATCVLCVLCFNSHRLSAPCAGRGSSLTDWCTWGTIAKNRAWNYTHRQTVLQEYMKTNSVF